MVLALVLSGSPVRAENLVERLLAPYDAVESLSCDVRKDTVSSEGRVRMLSRVYYQRPDRIHVENHAPARRRIIADGDQLYYHIEGHPRGFSRPIDELDDNWLSSVRKVPGTAMDHLFRLRGIDEIPLEPTDDFPVRRGYDAGRNYVVLSLDDRGRLAQIEFFASRDMDRMTARAEYSSFEEVLDGVWIPTLHSTQLDMEGIETRETSRFSNISVNEPIPEHLFDEAPFFRNVEWVSHIDEM